MRKIRSTRVRKRSNNMDFSLHGFMTDSYREISYSAIVSLLKTSFSTRKETRVHSSRSYLYRCSGHTASHQ
jgi:hypothetical protein